MPYSKPLKMPILQGLDRLIAADNEVRFIDAFMDKFDVEILEIIPIPCIMQSKLMMEEFTEKPR